MAHKKDEHTQALDCGSYARLGNGRWTAEYKSERHLKCIPLSVVWVLGTGTGAAKGRGKADEEL